MIIAQFLKRPSQLFCPTFYRPKVFFPDLTVNKNYFTYQALPLNVNVRRLRLLHNLKNIYWTFNWGRQRRRILAFEIYIYILIIYDFKSILFLECKNQFVSTPSGSSNNVQNILNLVIVFQIIMWNYHLFIFSGIIIEWRIQVIFVIVFKIGVNFIFVSTILLEG